MYGNDDDTENQNDFFIGIDPSLRSTGICIYNFKNDSYFFYVFSEKSKFTGKTKKLNNFRYKKNDRFFIEIEVYDKDVFDVYENYQIAESIYNNVFRYLTAKNIHSLYIEGYSMSSKGRVFDIAEFVGSLKGFFYRKGINFESVSPMTVKKEIGGKGNLKKEEIYESRWHSDICYEVISALEEIGVKYKKGHWIEDILDSYAVMEYGKRMYNSSIEK